MRVSHAVYGEGTITNQVGDVCTVLFDSGITKDVNRNTLLDVLHS